VSEKQISVRLHATGAEAFKATLVSLGRDGEKALKSIGTSHKTAATAAIAHAKAVRDDKQRIDALRASIDPAFRSSQRFAQAQAQIDAALRKGLISQGRANSMMVQAKQAYTEATVSVDRFGQSAGQRQFVMKNLAFQLNQIGQQGAVTGNYLGALSIQLPDILASFGLWGVLIGGATAVLGPMVIELLKFESASKAAKRAQEELGQAMSEARSATDRARQPYRQQVEEYGEMASHARELFEIERQIANARAGEALNAAARSVAGALGAGGAVGLAPEQIRNARNEVKALQGEIERLSQATMVSDQQFKANAERIGQMRMELGNLRSVSRNLDDLGDMLGITKANAREVAAQFAAIEASDNSRERADAMRDLAAFIIQTSDNLSDATEEGETLYRQLLSAAIEALNLSRLEISPGIKAAGDEASRLADELGRALSNATGLAASSVTDVARARIEYEYRDDPVGRAAALAGANFDAKSKLPDGVPGFVVDQISPDLQRQRQQVVNSAREAAQWAERTAAWQKAQSEAARKGRGASSAQKEQNEILKKAEAIYRSTRTETERYSEELAEARAVLEAGAISQETFNRHAKDLQEQFGRGEGYAHLRKGIDGVSEALARAGVYGDSLREGLHRVWQGIQFDILNSGIREALSQVFDSSGLGKGASAVGKSSGGGWIGKLLGAIFSFDGGGDTGNAPRRGGLDGRGGFLAMLHPQETVIDHTQPGRTGMSVLQRLKVSVEVTGAGNLRALVRDEAGSLIAQSEDRTVQRAVGAMSEASVYGSKSFAGI